MKIKVTLAFFLYSACLLQTTAQTILFNEAFEGFSTNRLYQFEEIPIDWKMEGHLQADLNEGLNYLYENNYTLAEVSLSLVIEKDSSIWQAYYYRAAARKHLRRYWLAKQDINKTLKIHGDFYEGYVELAKILYLHRQNLESERAINKAIKLDRTRGAAYHLKGDINLAQGETRNAINTYKDCLKADSMFHDARIMLALLDAISKKDPRASLKQLNVVLSYDSLQKTALLFRSLLGGDNKKQAIKDLSNLLLVSPNNVMGLYFRGLYAAELGDYEHGFRDFQKLIKFTSTNDNNFVGQQTWIDKKIDIQNAGAYTVTRVYGLPDEDASRIKEAYCQILLREYEKSLAVLEQVSNQKEPVAVYLKAVTYEHQGNHVKALQHYSLAIDIDDQIADAYKKRGIYEQEMEQWGKSVDDFSKVLQLTPDAFFTNRMRGVSYYHLNRYTEALADFNIYLKNDSTNKEVTGFRGMAYLKTNKRLKAYVDFATSGNHGSIDIKDMEKLVDSVLHAKDTVNALYVLNAVTKDAPYLTEAFVQKIRIHVARSEWNEVRKHIFQAVKNSRLDAGKVNHSYLLTVEAMVYLRESLTDDAVQLLNDAIKFDDKNELAYFKRGEIYLKMGKSSKATKDLEAASALGSEQARNMLATMNH